MKNEDMKVSELLEKKRKLENEVERVINSLKSVNDEFAPGHNYKDRGRVRVNCDYHSFEPSLDRDILKIALESQLTRLNEELSPIADKLAAIEMMLNS